jgi:flagellar protein FliS
LGLNSSLPALNFNPTQGANALSTNPLNAYRETQIKTANQGQLILMLYDGAIRSIDTAVDSLAHRQHKYDVVNNSIIKAQDIVGELMASLDFERGGDIAKNLFSLYLFMNRQLLDANLKKDDKPLRDVRNMLSTLRDAWSQVAGRSPSPEGPGSGVDING